jgi:hypothetical protein
MKAYEHRVIAYADILGWRNACGDLSKYLKLQTAAQAIADHARNFSPQMKERLKGMVGVSSDTIEQHGSVEFSFFSDNFALSVPPGQAETLFNILAWANDRLLHAGFLLRGGIALGALHHDHNVLFGPALIEAVELEKVADNPRLLCSADLSDFLDQQPYKDRVVIRDEDKLIANVALGSAHALADLSKLMEEELAVLTKNADKWSYLKKMLPRMHQAKGL